ncbi:MAG: hypothetical protein JW759_04420 [Candidatus Coatesbacteria bacterium]|nr:hypothetical protein [Candidatus Coatesbacteria bacterium]
MPLMRTLAVFAILCLIATSLWAAEVKVCDMFARPGTVQTLSIAVYNVPDMAGADVAINFDEQLLSAKAVSRGYLLASSPHEFLIASNLDPCPPGEDCPPPAPGLAKFSFASAEGIGASSGVVAVIACEALPAALEGQSTQLTFSLARFCNSVPEPFEVAAAPGTLHFTNQLAIGAAANKALYHSGEMVRLSAFAFNPFKSPREIDIYFAMLFPDGTLRFLPTLSTDYQEGRIGFVIQSDTSIPETPLFELIAGEALPTGNYTLYAAMTEPGTVDFIAPLWTASFWVASGR